MKECKRCGRTKSLDSFYKRLDKEARCKECVSEIRKAAYPEMRDKRIAYTKKYRDENPEKIRDTKLRQAYGVGVEYFEAKLKEQGGVCAGCKENVKVIWRGKEVRMALDHHHATGAPRGVLCIRCNRGLGLLQENPEVMINLIEYINKYKKAG